MSPGPALLTTQLLLPPEKAKQTWGGKRMGGENSIFNRIPDIYLALSALLCNFSSFPAVGLHSSLYACLETFLQKDFGAPTPPTEMTGLQPSKAPLPAPCMSSSLFTLRTLIPSSQEGTKRLVLLWEGLFAMTLRSLKCLASFLRQHRIRWLIIKLTDFARTLDTYGDPHQDSWGLCCVQTSAVFSNDH